VERPAADDRRLTTRRGRGSHDRTGIPLRAVEAPAGAYGPAHPCPADPGARHGRPGTIERCPARIRPALAGRRQPL